MKPQSDTGSGEPISSQILAQVNSGVANARLIGAAPELLAACEAILKKWDFHDVTQSELSAEDIDIYNLVSRAVQKAKGGV